MNLVQINERLKDMPMQVLQQYANGMNPEVPPYLALGELQRREMSQKQAATAQGAQQGPQPSIKEQVEQKAGLMALQQMQQQQAAQQMQQPRGPMPAPAGVPQPEPQPQAMMARGGLAGIPVRRDMFEYAGGGIIAFQSGGQSLNERAARQMEEKGSIYDPYFGLPAEERERMKQEATLKAAQDRASQGMAVTESNAQAMAEGARSRVSELESNREELVRKFGPRMYEQALSKAKQEIDAASSRGSELMAQQSQMGQERVAAATPPPGPMVTSQGPGMPVVPRRPIEPASGIAAALPKAGPAATERPAPPMAGPAAPPMPGTPRPAAPVQAGAPAGIAAALPQGSENPYMKQLQDMVAKKPVQPTEEDAISSIKKLSPAAMQEEAMQKRSEDARARAASEKALFEKMRPSGLDDLIRVWGQAAQYKGGTGIAPAYTANQQQRRAEELAMERRQNELMTAIEGRDYEGAKELFGARTRSFEVAKKLFGDESNAQIKAVADMAQVKQSEINNVLKMTSDRELKELELKSRALDRQVQGAGNQLKLDYIAMKAKARSLAASGDKTGAAEAEARANDMLTAQGGSAAISAAGPKPMTRDQASDNVAKIFDNPMMASKFIADAKSALATKGIANPTMTQIQEHLIQEQMKGASLDSSGPSGKVPAVGTVMDGYRFKGGNPANQSNWEKV